jgi:hypothetical protein
MSVRNIFAAGAIVTTVFGLLLLLAPDMMLANQGLVISSGARLYARAAGDGLLALAIATWLNRNDQGSGGQKGVAFANIFLHAFAIPIDFSEGTPAGTLWIGPAIHIVFIIAFSFAAIRLTRPQPVSSS